MIRNYIARNRLNLTIFKWGSDKWKEREKGF